MPLDDAAQYRLAAELGRRLLARGARVVTAESCTGGLIAGAITAVAGSSNWFERGFVTYSDDAKCEMLGVPRDLIATHGAVSEPVALAMANGALAASGAQCAVAVTGVAGPAGGSAEKPVGMVCFAWSDRGVGARSRTLQFPGGRGEVRAASVIAALGGLLDLLNAGPPRAQ